MNQQRIWCYLLPGLGLALLGANIEAKPVVSGQIAHFESGRVNVPPELQAQEKWAAFKALWRELGAIKPIHLENSPPDGRLLISIGNNERIGPWGAFPGYGKRTYYQSLNMEQAEHFQQQLDNIFGNNIVSVQAQMLFRLTQLRIQEMSAAHRPLQNAYDVTADREEMMTRAGPSFTLAPIPPTLYLVNALDRIAFRAKALMSLRAKGAVGEAAFVSALDALQKDAKLVLYLDTLLTTEKKTDRFRAHSSAILEPMDFIQSGRRSQLKDVDMQSIQAWEGAFRASRVRLRNNNTSNDIFPVDEHDDKTGKNAAEDRVQALIQKLDRLRSNFEALEPLLAELER